MIAAFWSMLRHLWGREQGPTPVPIEIPGDRHSRRVSLSPQTMSDSYIRFARTASELGDYELAATYLWNSVGLMREVEEVRR